MNDVTVLYFMFFFFNVVVSRSFGRFSFFAAFEGKPLPLGSHGEAREGRSSFGAVKCECAVIEDVVERQGGGGVYVLLGAPANFSPPRLLGSPMRGALFTCSIRRTKNCFGCELWVVMDGVDCCRSWGRSLCRSSASPRMSTATWRLDTRVADPVQVGSPVVVRFCFHMGPGDTRVV
jgi:hypothetical protein